MATKTKAELIEEAEGLGLEVDAGMTNAALAEAIEEETKRRSEGGDEETELGEEVAEAEGAAGGEIRDQRSETGDDDDEPEAGGTTPPDRVRGGTAGQAGRGTPDVEAPGGDSGAAGGGAPGDAVSRQAELMDREREDARGRLHELARKVGEGSLTEGECAGEVAQLLAVAGFDRDEWPGMVRLARRRAELRKVAGTDTSRLVELVDGAERALVRTREERSAAIEQLDAKVAEAEGALLTAKAEVLKVEQAREELVGCAPSYLRDQLAEVRRRITGFRRDLPNLEHTADYWAGEVKLRGDLERGASAESGKGQRLRERTEEARQRLTEAEGKIRDMREELRLAEESVEEIRKAMAEA